MPYIGYAVDGNMKLSETGEVAENCWQEIPEHFPFVKLDAFIVMPNQSKTRNKFGTQSLNLASIVRGYKTGVTKNARKINPVFAWQSRFYDHIIRDEKP
jgi:hypothetical protein